MATLEHKIFLLITNCWQNELGSHVAAQRVAKLVKEKFTSTNSDYAAALKVYREYRSDDKNYSTGGFAEFCEKRLHS